MKGRLAKLQIISASAKVKSTFFLPSAINFTFLAKSNIAFSSFNLSSESSSRCFSMHEMNYLTSVRPGLKRFFTYFTLKRISACRLTRFKSPSLSSFTYLRSNAASQSSFSASKSHFSLACI